MQHDLKRQTDEELDRLKVEFGDIFMENIPSMLTKTETVLKVDSQTDEVMPSKCPPLAVLLLRVRCIQAKIASELLVPFSVPEEIEGRGRQKAKHGLAWISKSQIYFKSKYLACFCPKVFQARIF